MVFTYLITQKYTDMMSIDDSKVNIQFEKSIVIEI